jgi:tetratricopeptide (TPR) repeat protein
MRQSKSQKVVPFLKNSSYYFQKGSHYCQQNKLEKALLFFKKTIEVEPDNSLNHYNLGSLLSRMGYLEKANQVFSYIVNQMDPDLTECYFFIAVNHGLMDNLEKARYYLNLYLQFSPDGEMAVDAEDLLYALSEEEGEGIFPDNNQNNNDVVKVPSEEGKKIIGNYRESKSVRSILWQALYHKDELIVEKAISMYGSIMEGIGEENLRDFVRNPWIKKRLRVQALLELKNMGVKGLVTIFLEGSLRDVDLSYYPLLASRWLPQWQDILDCTLKNMRLSKAYSERFYEDAQAIWIDFLNNTYPQLPSIKKIETWAAGLEYALSKFHFLNVTQKKLAEKYGVSSSSISNKYKEINEVLNIEHRAYHNMLIYLTKHEKE